MRVLYPSAHHDRFAHSIGVYHLGSMAFDHIYNHSNPFFKNTITEDRWELLKNTFLITCLMHNCGHSPFSHTFEDAYLFQREVDIKHKLVDFFAEEPEFSGDFDSASHQPHEIISALVLLIEFKEAIKKSINSMLTNNKVLWEKIKVFMHLP